MRLTQSALDEIKARLATPGKVTQNTLMGEREVAKAQRSKGKATQVSEAEVLRAVGRYLRVCPEVAWFARMNTGAVRMGDRFVRFGLPGMSDFLGQMKDGRLLACECKSTNGSTSADQSHFLARVSRFGGVSGVARSVEDVIRLFKAHSSRENDAA